MTIELLTERPSRDGGRLGWHRHHKPENRNFPVASALAPATALSAKSWKRARTPLNQGQLGSCTGNACEVMAYERPSHVAAVTKTEAQAVALYKKATQLDAVPGAYPPTDTGSTTVGVLAAAKAAAYIGSYRWAFAFTEAQQTLAQLGPLITGVEWYEGFDNPKSNGELVIAGQVRGGHELCLDQIDPNAPGWGGNGVVVGWNSWGPTWGPLGGRFIWSFATWRKLLEAGGEVGIGLS